MTKLVKKDLKLRTAFEKLNDDIRKLSEEMQFLKDKIEVTTGNIPATTDKKYLRILKVNIFPPFYSLVLLS